MTRVNLSPTITSQKQTLTPFGAITLCVCSLCSCCALTIAQKGDLGQPSRYPEGWGRWLCSGKCELASSFGLRRKIKQVFLFPRQVLQLAAVTRYSVHHRIVSRACCALN